MTSKLFLKQDFIKNALTLVMGTGLAQAIPLLSSPFLARIFSPVDFGRLAFFMALCAILTTVATGLYELSIMLPKKDVVAYNILFLVIICSGLCSALILLMLMVFGEFLLSLFNSPLSLEYMLLLPIGVFFSSAFQGLNYWLSRKKEYKLMNISKITQSLTTVVVSMALGYFGFKSHGLIIAFVVGCVISTIPLIFLFAKEYAFLSRTLALTCAKQYLNYPKLVMPTTLMNTAAGIAPVFFITKLFSPVAVGGYSLASRTLTAPVGIISSAIGQVYFQKVSEIVRTGTKEIFPVVISMAKTLTSLSFLLFLPFFFWGEEIFRVVFGKEWAVSGKYVEIISLGIFFKFVVSPLSTLLISTNNLLTLSIWQLIYFCSTVSVLYFGRHLILTDLLWNYVLNEIILYLLYFILMVIVSKKFDKKLVIKQYVMPKENHISN